MKVSRMDELPKFAISSSVKSNDNVSIEDVEMIMGVDGVLSLAFDFKEIAMRIDTDG